MFSTFALCFVKNRHFFALYFIIFTPNFALYFIICIFAETKKEDDIAKRDTVPLKIGLPYDDW